MGCLYRACVRTAGEAVSICGECGAVWREAGHAPRVTNYSAYAEAPGQLPLRAGLELLSAAGAGEETP